jgi:hypothetical protein
MQNKQRTLNIGLMIAGALPALVSLACAVSMLSIAWPDLAPEQRKAFAYGLLLTLAPGVAAGGAGLWYFLRRRVVSVTILVALVLAEIMGGYLYLRYVHVTISVAEWIFDQGEYMTLIFSAIIPVFYYLLYYIAMHFGITTRRSLVSNIIAAILLPVVAYISFNLLRNVFVSGLGADLQQMYLIGLTTVFSFIMLRLLLHVASKHAVKLENPEVIWSLRLIFVGVLPLVGLLLNAYGPVARESQMVLGNFNSADFWLLAAFNALVYLVPDIRHRALQIFMTILRLAGLVFVLYFCVIFLLFVPLALLLIAAIGLGFLLLIPYFAAAMQLLRLKQDFALLRAYYSRMAVVAIAVAGLGVLPAVVLGDMYLDRAALVQGLEYVQHAPLAVNQKPRIDDKTVLRLTQKRAAKQGRRAFNDAGVPIFDRVYRNIVLDGAELSDTLRARLRHVFLGEAGPQLIMRTSSAKVRAFLVSVAQKGTGTTMTESILRIRIRNEDISRAAEFDTNIYLPDNAFVTQHWLTIDGVEVPAQITTRSLALWVYNRVTERMRDPSLIYYDAANQLRWKIFPVPAAGYREARLHVTHAGNATLRIGREVVQLNGLSVTNTITSNSGGYALLPAATPQELTARKPYLHFIADCSAAAGATYLQDAKLAAEYLALDSEGARVSYVNAGITTQALPSLSEIRCPSERNGFFFELALRALVYEQATKSDFPVFVVLSPQTPYADWNELSYLLPYYGDTDAWVHAAPGAIKTFDFAGRVRSEKPRLRLPVRRFGDRHFSASARLVPGKAQGEKMNLIDGAEYHHDFVLGNFAHRQRAVLAALQTGTLNPATGSIVLETEAQRLKLSELHKKMLSAKNELDTGERARMSEPSTWLMLLLLLPVWYLRQRLRKRRVLS